VPHRASLGRIAMRGLVTNALGTQRVAHSHVTAVNIVHIGVAKLTRSELGSITVSGAPFTWPVVLHVMARAVSVVTEAIATFRRRLASGCIVGNTRRSSCSLGHRNGGRRWSWHRGGGGHWFRRGTGGRGRDGLWRGQGCWAYSGLLRGSDHRSGGWRI
jgi:hypothetical protein